MVMKLTNLMTSEVKDGRCFCQFEPVLRLCEVVSLMKLLFIYGEKKLWLVPCGKIHLIEMPWMPWD
jgi:hypothetical protein